MLKNDWREEWGTSIHRHTEEDGWKAANAKRYIIEAMGKTKLTKISFVAATTRKMIANFSLLVFIRHARMA